MPLHGDKDKGEERVQIGNTFPMCRRLKQKSFSCQGREKGRLAGPARGVDRSFRNLFGLVLSSASRVFCYNCNFSFNVNCKNFSSVTRNKLHDFQRKPTSLSLRVRFSWVLVLGLGFANGLSGFSNCLALLVPEQLDFNYCIKAAPTNFVVI